MYLVWKLNVNWCLFGLLNETRQVSRAICLFSILRDCEIKAKEYPGNQIEVGAMFSHKLGLIRMIRKSFLVLLPRMIESLRDRIISSNFYNISKFSLYHTTYSLLSGLEALRSKVNQTSLQTKLSNVWITYSRLMLNRNMQAKMLYSLTKLSL